MRVVVGGMNHESNTLNPIITGADDFVVFRGEELLKQGLLPYYSSTGIIRTLEAAGCQIIPILIARAVPNGVVSAALYRSLKEEFLRRVREALAEGPVDGICLGLHGSMKVEGLGCAEGDLLEALRELLPRVPCSVALDTHATITPLMLRHADAFVGYKTAPHVDCAETGAHAASMLLKSLQTGKKLTTAWKRVPMLIAGEKSESEAEPMRSLFEACRKVEAEGRALAASYLLGFPWADDEHEAVAVLVTTLDDEGGAKGVARELAEKFWERRRDFRFRAEHYDSREALDAAYRAVLEEGQRPVFLSDSGDNPTAGAAGDATDILEKILATMESADRLPTPLLYSGFYDAPAAAACVTAGVGSILDLTVGGNWDRVNGKKIPLRVKVVAMARNFGPYKADLVLVAYCNLRIVLTSKHIGFGDEELLPALGVEASEHCLVVVKLGYLEPCFRQIARRAILATSRGCSNEVLESIPYSRLTRPLYPLDPDMEASFD